MQRVMLGLARASGYYYANVCITKEHCRPLPHCPEPQWGSGTGTQAPGTSTCWWSAHPPGRACTSDKAHAPHHVTSHVTSHVTGVQAGHEVSCGQKVGQAAYVLVEALGKVRRCDGCSLCLPPCSPRQECVRARSLARSLPPFCTFARSFPALAPDPHSNLPLSRVTGLS